MKKSFTKIISLLLIVGMNWSAISLIAGTDAYFNDTEISENNILTAGILDFELAGDTFTPEVNLEQDATKTISVVDTTSTMNYDYTVRVDDASLSGNLCGCLLLEDNVSGAGQQSLSSFVSGEVLHPDTTDWTFTASLDPSAGSGWEGEVCNFDFIYEGHQEDCGGGGFSDIERISNTITAGEMKTHLLITKVYYDVCNKTHEKCGEYKGKASNEWVEIYNPTDSLKNISGWQICDGGFCDTISSSHCNLPSCCDDASCDDASICSSSSPPCSIPSGGFAVITNESSTWDYWNIPSNVIKIELGEKIGNGLNDHGDSVILKDPSGYEVDAMSYGNDTSVFDLSPLGVTEGHMFGRVPVGQDTDTVADWQDLGLPVVSVINVSPLQGDHDGCCGNGNENVSQIDCLTEWHSAPGLYYSQELDITWNAATNNSSGNSGLSIDIVYITDEDCSGDISDGDSRYTLASGESNDGFFSWNGWTDINKWYETLWEDENGDNVPYFYGLTWIEIIATGPENFMVNDSAISDPMFEPLPPMPQGVSVDMEQIRSILEESSSCDGCCSAGLDDYLEANFETDDFVEDVAEPAASSSDSDGETQDGDATDDERDGSADGDTNTNGDAVEQPAPDPSPREDGARQEGNGDSDPDDTEIKSESDGESDDGGETGSDDGADGDITDDTTDGADDDSDSGAEEMKTEGDGADGNSDNDINTGGEQPAPDPSPREDGARQEGNGDSDSVEQLIPDSSPQEDGTGQEEGDSDDGGESAPDLSQEINDSETPPPLPTTTDNFDTCGDGGNANKADGGGTNLE